MLAVPATVGTVGEMRYQTVNNNELKEALLNQRPVILNQPLYGELHYSCVSAIIYRVKNGKLDISAELKDKCGRSVTIAAPKQIRYED